MGREEKKEMCLFRDKWPKGELTEEYIKATKEIRTITELKIYLRQFELKKDKWDHWQSPAETYERKMGDCEDMAIMVLDILTRAMKIKEAWFIIYAGYYINKEGKKKYSAHAVILFYHMGGHKEYSNKTYSTAKTDFIKQGYMHYPEGLKSYERRDRTGKIIERKRKWIGFL